MLLAIVNHKDVISSLRIMIEIVFLNVYYLLFMVQIERINWKKVLYDQHERKPIVGPHGIK